MKTMAEKCVIETFSGFLFSWIVGVVLAAVVGAAITSKAKTSPVAVNVPQTNPSSQYHAQDEFGQYSYGYTNADGQSKAEVKGIDGSITGKYSYVDGNGKRLEVAYVADDAGFRAVGDHLPSNVVPKLPLHLAQAYQEANKRLSDAYAYAKGKATASKENNGGKKEDEKEEEEEEEGEKKQEQEEEDEKEQEQEEGDEKKQEQEEGDEKEEEKKKKEKVVKIVPDSKPNSVSVPTTSISTPVFIGHFRGSELSPRNNKGYQNNYAIANVHVQPKKSAPRQLVYLVGTVVSRSVASSSPPVTLPAPVKNLMAPPVGIQGATVRLIKAAPIRATEYSFHTYVPTIHQQSGGTRGKGVAGFQVPVQEYGVSSQSRYAIAPGYGLVPMP